MTAFACETIGWQDSRSSREWGQVPLHGMVVGFARRQLRHSLLGRRVVEIAALRSQRQVGLMVLEWVCGRL